MIIGGIIKGSESISGPLKQRLAGRALVDGSPAKRRVVVQKRGTLEYVASTMSDPVTGNWEIRGMPELPERSVLVTVIADTVSFDPITFDNVSMVE